MAELTREELMDLFGPLVSGHQPELAPTPASSSSDAESPEAGFWENPAALGEELGRRLAETYKHALTDHPRTPPE